MEENRAKFHDSTGNSKSSARNRPFRASDRYWKTKRAAHVHCPSFEKEIMLQNGFSLCRPFFFLCVLEDSCF